MVLPSSGSLSVQTIETEFQLGTAVAKSLGTDLGPLIGITAGTTINLGSSFYGKAYAQAVTTITQGATTSSSITLNWSGGSGATSFSITSNPATTTQTASSSGYTFTGLAASTSYTFTIVSKNAQGVSGGSATSGSFTTSAGYLTVNWDRTIITDYNPSDINPAPFSIGDSNFYSWVSNSSCILNMRMIKNAGGTINSLTFYIDRQINGGASWTNIYTYQFIPFIFPWPSGSYTQNWTLYLYPANTLFAPLSTAGTDSYRLYFSADQNLDLMYAQITTTGSQYYAYP